ncbi:MAG: UDP-N-acetylmuramoyl-L-alanine--D-glutamate ligase [Acidobacteria bacterium]|nr:UDP-N-acetylmuramoyl-L-alanine--D-glutamate ligase [Acidobacteriota bacterium]
MIDVRGKNVLVVGLARTGLAVARCLAQRGAVVTVTDLRPPQLFSKEIRELLDQKIGMELGLHREETFLRHDVIVVSPGVPADLPLLEVARRKGIPVVPEIEVASWFLDGRLAGITGTNGKTTTTALLGKILEASGFSTFVGGNIGVPLLSALDQVPPASVVVAELSSFQLETIHSFRPEVAVLLNLTPNHLDRHADFEAYIAAKARIFENQTENDYAILNADDDKVVSLAPGIRSRKIYFSRQRELASGVFISGGKIRYRVRNLEVDLMATRDVRLRGEFNLENVLAAAAAACVLGAEFASIRRAVREFHGVEHRLEFVGEIQGVAFYNDSKATSVDAAQKALSTFEQGVHLILGGKDKGAPYEPLRSLLKDRVREILVIGADRERIRNELAGTVDIIDAVELETAVRKAFERAETGDVILLAPACASFDQFENFEHRGREFKDLVERLAGENSGKAGVQRSRSAGKSEGKIIESAATDASLAVCGAPQLSSRWARESAPRETVSRARVVHPALEQEAFRLSTPRELEYIYEVSAEETSPGPGVDFYEGTEEPRPDTADLTSPEEVEDEVLAFEVRPSSGDKLAVEAKERGSAVRAGSGEPTTSRRME